MELKDLITTIVICLIVSCLVVVYLPNFLPKQEKLGTTFLQESISAAGFQVKGTEVINSSRVFTGVDGTFTGDITVTDELNLGTSVSNPGCIKFYTTNGLAYIYGVTTSAAGTMTITSTKPAVCP